MHLLPVWSMCLFSLLCQGTVGLAVALAVADTGGGWERDHPPHWWRTAGMILPGLAAVALLAPFVDAVRRGGGWAPAPWMLLAVAALMPFGALTLAWGMAWSEGRPAPVRRRWGSRVLLAGVMGLAVTATFMTFLWQGPLWRSGITLALMAGTAGVIGGLGGLFLAARDRRRGLDDASSDLAPVAPDAPPGLVHMVTGGLVASALALSEVGWGWYSGGGPREAGLYLGLWLLGGVAAPGWAAYRQLAVWPLRTWAWPVALTVALAGQWAAHHLLFMYGSIGPPLL